MNERFEVFYTEAAKEDLLRLFDFLLDRAETLEDLDAAQSAIDAIKTAVEVHLSQTPFLYRKSGQSAFQRELVVPFRAGGYVALYEIATDRRVNAIAIRHQREDDYY